MIPKDLILHLSVKLPPLLPFLLLAFSAPSRLPAGDPPSDPILRIEAEMHTATIRRIATDKAGKVLLTCSDDKTARLWALPDASHGPGPAKPLKPVRIFRPPQGEGNEGKLYSCALTPDGGTAAIGGWTGYEWDESNCIYLFETASGRMIGRLSNLGGVPLDMGFSATGRYLAATLGDRHGVRVWETATWKEVGRDEDYNASSHGLGWSGDSRLATVCDDLQVRLYNIGAGRLELLSLRAMGGGLEPYTARFSPDGKELAVGYYNSAVTSIHDAGDLRPLYKADVEGVDSTLGTVTWLQNQAGEVSVAAAGQWQMDGDFSVRFWPRRGRGAATVVKISAQTIMDMRPLPDGRLVFSSSEPAWGVAGPATRPVEGVQPAKDPRITLGQSPVANFRDNHAGFRLAADASEVSFAFEVFGAAPATFSVSDRSLKIGMTELPQHLRPSRMEGLAVTDWQNSTKPLLNGTPLKLEAYESSRSFAIAPDAGSFILGSDWYLRRFDLDGQEVWKRAAPGGVWGVNYSADGHTVAAAYTDGTIRWHRTDDGRELLAFFPHADRQRWVLWTPQGYYDCSPDGESLIGWHVNRGKNQEADFFPAAQFRERFYRPDVIGRVLEHRDVAAALQSANRETGRRPQALANAEEVIRQMQPPVVELVMGGASGEIETSEATLTLRYRVRRTGTEAITKVRLLIDGRPLDLVAPIPADGDVAQIAVPLPERDCVLSVLAEHRFAISQPATLRVQRKDIPPGPDPSARLIASTPLSLRPKLYLLAVGISDYARNDRLGDLAYAAKDATDFAGAFRRQEGGLYQKVEVRLLTDAKATAGDILDGLDWIKSETTAKDLAVILFSGHGENDEELRYYFCAQDYDHSRRLRTGVAMEEIQRTISSIAGKVLFFIDSCHAGNALGKMYAAKGAGLDINRMVNELSSAENGAVVFASSTGRQISVESEQWQNGAFTKAIVEGLDGRADLMRNGKITVSGLEAYISERVKELSEGTQTPTVAKPQTVPDFPIAIGH